MVSRKIFLIFAFLVCIPAYGQGLVLIWDGTNDVHCHKLIDDFLSELRSLAIGRTIELDIKQPQREMASGQEELQVKCAGEAVEVSDATEKLTLRYSKKAMGFDSRDWLQFQKKYLKPSLALQPEFHPELAVKNTIIESQTPPEESIFKKWWFWSAITLGAGAAAYLGFHELTHQEPVHVEIQ